MMKLVDYLLIFTILALCAPKLWANDPPLPIAATSWQLVVPQVVLQVAPQSPTPPQNPLGLRDLMAQAQPVPVKRTLDGKFVALSGVLIGAALFDQRTTYSALARCANCREGNPILAPIINNRAAAYSVSLGITGATIAGAYYLKKRGRSYWWLPIAVGAAAHVAAGVANSRIH